MKKFKEAGDSQYIYLNKPDKACFQDDMTYGDFINLTRRTKSDRILRDKALTIAKNRKFDGYRRGLAPMVFKFLTKRLQAEQLKTRICKTSN